MNFKSTDGRKYLPFHMSKMKPGDIFRVPYNENPFMYLDQSDEFVLPDNSDLIYIVSISNGKLGWIQKDDSVSIVDHFVQEIIK